MSQQNQPERPRSPAQQLHEENFEGHRADSGDCQSQKEVLKLSLFQPSLSPKSHHEIMNKSYLDRSMDKKQPKEVNQVKSIGFMPANKTTTKSEKLSGP